MESMQPSAYAKPKMERRCSAHCKPGCIRNGYSQGSSPSIFGTINNILFGLKERCRTCENKIFYHVLGLYSTNIAILFVIFFCFVSDFEPVMLHASDTANGKDDASQVFRIKSAVSLNIIKVMIISQIAMSTAIFSRICKEIYTKFTALAASTGSKLQSSKEYGNCEFNALATAKIGKSDEDENTHLESFVNQGDSSADNIGCVLKKTIKSSRPDPDSDSEPEKASNTTATAQEETGIKFENSSTKSNGNGGTIDEFSYIPYVAEDVDSDSEEESAAVPKQGPHSSSKGNKVSSGRSSSEKRRISVQSRISLNGRTREFSKFSAFDTPLYRAVNNLERLRDIISNIPAQHIHQMVTEQLERSEEQCFGRSERKRWDTSEKNRTGSLSIKLISQKDLPEIGKLPSRERRVSTPPNSADGSLHFFRQSELDNTRIPRIRRISDRLGPSGYRRDHFAEKRKNLRRCASQETVKFSVAASDYSYLPVYPLEIIDSVLESLRSPDSLMKPLLHKSFSGDLSWFIASGCIDYPLLQEDESVANRSRLVKPFDLSGLAALKELYDGSENGIRCTCNLVNCLTESSTDKVDIERQKPASASEAISVDKIRNDGDLVCSELVCPGAVLRSKYPSSNSLSVVSTYCNSSEECDTISNGVYRCGFEWNLDVVELAQKLNVRPLSHMLIEALTEYGHTQEFKLDEDSSTMLHRVGERLSK